MEEKNNDKPVDYRVHESILARMERTNKRWFVLCIVIFLAFVGSNIGWLIYESQFEDISTTVTQNTQSESGNAIIYGEHAGAVIYGEGKSNSNNQNQTP